MSSNIITKYEWFRIATSGYKESDYKYKLKHGELPNHNECFDKHAFMQVETMQHLRESYKIWKQLQLHKTLTVEHKIPLTILTSSHLHHRQFISLSYLQSLPENQQAIFLVETLTNGLHGPIFAPVKHNTKKKKTALEQKANLQDMEYKASWQIDQDMFLTQYALYPNESVHASIGTAKATLDRYFHMPLLSHAQSSTSQVNVLARLSDSLPVHAQGIIQLPGKNSHTDINTSQIQVFIHRNIQVVLIESESPECFTLASDVHDVDVPQCVDHVLAACLMDLNVNHIIGQKNKLFEEVYQFQRAKLLMETCIESAYLAAIDKLTRCTVHQPLPIRLFLTPIGIETKGNSISWFLESVAKVHLRYQEFIGHLIHVYLVGYEYLPKRYYKWRKYFQACGIECNIQDVQK